MCLCVCASRSLQWDFKDAIRPASLLVPHVGAHHVCFSKCVLLLCRLLKAVTNCNQKAVGWMAVVSSQKANYAECTVMELL